MYHAHCKGHVRITSSPHNQSILFGRGRDLRDFLVVRMADSYVGPILFHIWIEGPFIHDVDHMYKFLVVLKIKKSLSLCLCSCLLSVFLRLVFSSCSLSVNSSSDIKRKAFLLCRGRLSDFLLKTL